LLLLFLSEPVVFAQRAVFIVRHAERADDSSDTVLSSEGEARARSLARLLRDAGISAIFVTQYRRSAQTAKPLADQLGIESTVVQARDISGMVAKIRTEHANEAVLAVGHSDTVPAIIRALGCRESIEISTDEYDNLFVVVPDSGGESPLLLRLRF